MMHLERRKGEFKPVIKKALVELDGDMFKSYEAVREKWQTLDCYTSPGPIQFEGVGSTGINFLVKPPSPAVLLKETEEHEKFEMGQLNQGSSIFHRDVNSLSALSMSRIQAKPQLPETLESGNFVLVGIKKYQPFS